MSRMVSFVVLVAILLVIAVLFFRVMANFLLPMFLAVLLVVMFGPVHRWFVAKCNGRDRLAAGLTTAAILLIFLAPLLLIVFQAVSEGVDLYHLLENVEFNRAELNKRVAKLNEDFGLKLTAEGVEETIRTKAQEWLAPMALGTTQYVGGFLLGLGVTVISLYYFLADGPAMVRTMMHLSPLDDRYEEQLIVQFANVSRAVVLATLVSAVAQGILTGIGIYLAGFQAVFLLMVLTMLLAMIPFVGAAAVWIPASLWLFFYEGHTLAAVLLAVYGAAIISMADNVIKPFILHGRSNLHPLLALLSVLGGVQALGPIGIFVGPMVVAFLQTLLNMLHTELEAMSSRPAAKEAPATGTPQPGPAG